MAAPARQAASVDVVDAIEAIAAREIAELEALTRGPDNRLTEEVIDRLQKLLDLVKAARQEQREQQKWVAKLPDEELERR